MKLLALVMLMSGVTLFSRLLPSYLLKKLSGIPVVSAPHPMRDSARRLLRRSLSLIPYSALGALIFPGVFTGKTPFSYAAAAGASAAVASSLLGGGLVPSVVASVAAAFAVLLLTGS